MRDHLGSLDVITDSSGVIIQEMSFDPWGQRRNATTWEALSAAALIAFDHTITTRGFTGHEMLDEVGIVHMNGRIYDPKLGRFLQADPFVQDFKNTQSFNRYSYVLNNPLNATDPSGYFLDIVGWAFAGLAAGWLGNELDIPVLSTIGNIAVCSATGGVACAATFAFASTVGAGGSISDAFRNGLFAGLSAAAFGKIGDVFRGTGLEGGITHIAAHATAGGILSELQGGKFGHGFLSAGITKAVSLNEILPGSNAELDFTRVVMAATIGGTVSEITGGKFSNGAITAAFAQAYNGNRAEAERVAAETQKPIVAGIYGAGGPRSGENPTLENYVTKLGGKMFKAGQKSEIIDYLSAGAAEGREVRIFGYSRGGNAAISVANALGKEGIEVALLVTFDPHSIFDGKTFKLKHNNVRAAHNFYQRNPRTGGRLGFWGTNPYWGSPVSSSHITVNQKNFTNSNYREDTPVSHLNIIRHSLGSF